MSFPDPRQHFPQFYYNSTIRALSSAERWTVSGRLGENPSDTTMTRKAPIDIRHLFETGRIRGAWATDEQCLASLDEMSHRLPNAANLAFHLEATVDGVLVIDIEPDCPAEIAANLLALPELLYTETSMSGRGYHLLAPLPSNFYDHPVAAGKRVLRHEQGFYEILLHHWITFTRRPISADVLKAVHSRDLADSPFTSVADVYAFLAQRAKPRSGQAIDIAVAENEPEIAAAEQLVAETISMAQNRLKDPAEFHGDMSRYEFSVLRTLFRQLQTQTSLLEILGETRYSASDKAWLLYFAARKVLPPRSKHHELRNGRPYLLEQAASMIAQTGP